MRFDFLYTSCQPYVPEDIKTRAIGGTEVAVYNLAFELAELGHQVNIFVETDEEIILDNFAWRKAESFVPGECDVFVSVENFTEENFIEGVKNFIWMHIPVEFYKPEWVRNDFPNLTKYIALSKFHQAKFLETYPVSEDSFLVLSDPIDIPSLIEMSRPGFSPKIVNTSRPERGVRYLPGIFKRVKAEIPEAELHLFTYKTGDTKEDPLGMSSSTLDIQQDQQVLYQELLDAGIEIHEGLPRHKLWEFMSDCTVMASPTGPGFSEAFGMSHAEALALGLNVVVTNAGNTPDIVQDLGVIIDGDPATDEVQEQFAQAIIDGIKRGRDKMREKQIRVSEFDARNVTRRFLMEIAEYDYDYAFLSKSTYITPTSTEDGPLGGSETALIHMARMLAEKGKTVCIYGDVMTGQHLGVDFYHEAEIPTGMSCDHFVSFRHPGNFGSIPANHKHLWLEDDTDQEFMEKLGSPESNAMFDSVWVLSDYHKVRVMAMGVPAHKIIQITNGVDFGTIPETVERDPKKAIYASTPFRGLRELIDMAPEFHKLGLETHVFSSMGVYHSGDEEYESMYEEVRNAPGLVYRGAVSRLKLMEEMSTASLFFHPSTFAETCCSVVLEAQAAGCVPIVNALGSLPEKVLNGYTGVVTTLGGFTEDVAMLVQDEARQEALRAYGLNWAKRSFGWNEIVDGLLKEIDSVTAISVEMYHDKFRLRQGIGSDKECDRVKQYYREYSKSTGRTPWVEDYSKFTKTSIGHLKLDAIRRFLSDDKEVSILDIGCWTGGIVAEISKDGYKHIDALDISPEAIEVAKGHAPDVNFLIEDIEQYQFSGKYDFIIMTEVLEHLLDPHATLRWVEENLLSEKGMICFTVPLKGSPYGHDNESEHIHMFTRDMFPEYITYEDRGFIVGTKAASSKIETDIERCPDLSVCILAKNEAKDIAECLESIKPIAAEIIVLDDHSTDQTATIARKLGAKVYTREDKAFRFDEAKNELCKYAKKPWIFVIDADEMIDPASARLIVETLKDPKADGFEVIQKNLSNDGSIAGAISNNGEDPRFTHGAALYDRVPILRIFRNIPEIYFVHPVHEILQPSMLENGLKIGKLDVSVYNRGNLDKGSPKDNVRRDLYLRLGQLKAEEENDSKAWFELAIEFKMHDRHAEALEPYKKALELEPDNEKFWMNYGISLVMADQREEGIKAYEKSVELRPDYHNAYNNMGVAYMELDRDKAKECFQKAIDIKPDFTTAVNNLALFD